MKNIINGVNLQSVANVIIDQDRKDSLQNLPDKSIIWCKTDYLGNLFQELKQYKNKNFVLISHCSDHSITEKVFNHKPKCISKWFAQNVDYKHPDLIPIPIGVENHFTLNKGSYTNFSVLENNVFDFKIKNKIINKLYSNFGNTHPSRNLVRNILLKNNIGIQDPRVNYEQYTARIKEFLFVASPRGNGIDTHRTWESLYFGCIPIVEKHFMFDEYKELPIIQITDWDQVNTDFLKPYIEQYKKGSCFKQTEKLNLNYWLTTIQETSKNI